MHLGVLLLGLGLLNAACGGDVATGGRKQGGTTNLDSSAKQCHPLEFGNAPGACRAGSALVTCVGANGGCTCISDDSTKCASCAEQFPEPLSCENKCGANEYALSCGGPPRHDGNTYQEMPANCRIVLSGPGGGQSACCPCL